MKNRNLLFLFLAGLFIIETSLFHWLIPTGWHSHIHIAPRFVVVTILFVALYSNRHLALILGLVFGLLLDVTFYGYMIGPYVFGLGLMGYITGLIYSKYNVGFLTAIPVIVLAIFTLETIIFGLYRLFRLTDVSYQWIFVHHMIPTVLLNMLFALLVYIPLREWINKVNHESGQEEQES